jgi:hypothetical protein
MEEEFEDTKGVIRIRISKTNGQHNGQKKTLCVKNGPITHVLVHIPFGLLAKYLL